MAFRNPIRSLPFSSITGQITAGQIGTGAVTAPALGPGAVTTPALGPGAVTASALGAGAVTAPALGTGAVTAPALGTGAVGYQALAVGTGNLVPDPSFEGAYAQTLVSASWAVDATGNNSAHSLKVSTTTASGTKTKGLTKIQVIPGEKYYLAFDYTTSADWAGTAVKFYLTYRDAAGAILTWGVAQDVPTPGAAWKRVSALVTVPANAATADVAVEHNGSSIGGSTWFDNVELRTALVAGAVSAGLITTGMLAAGSVAADKLAANAVTAGAIAANAVTAGTIAANAVTAAAIAANTITGDRLVAGTITADLLDVNALNGKTITGSTVQTATSGPRIVLSPDGTLTFPTGSAGELYPARMDPNGSAVSLDIMGPRSSVATPPDYGIQLRQQGSKTTTSITSDTTTITGILSAGNMAWGSVSITPVANTNTSTTVTGVGLPSTATSFRVWLLANSSAPDEIKAVTATGASADGFTLWIDRTTATTTNVWWLMLAK